MTPASTQSNNLYTSTGTSSFPNSSHIGQYGPYTSISSDRAPTVSIRSQQGTDYGDSEQAPPQRLQSRMDDFGFGRRSASPIKNSPMYQNARDRASAASNSYSPRYTTYNEKVSCPVPGCNLDSDSKTAMYKHVDLSHDEYRFVCRKLNHFARGPRGTFSTGQGRDKHENEGSVRREIAACVVESCNLEFPSTPMMYSHVLSSHPGHRFPCRKSGHANIGPCKAVFVTGASRDIHGDFVYNPNASVDGYQYICGIGLFRIDKVMRHTRGAHP